MGSTNAPGIPVPGKTPETYRRMDTRTTKTDAANDTVITITTDRPELNRPLGSGCIIVDEPGGAVAVCTETVVWGLQQAGTSSSERIASKVGAVRDLGVTQTGNITDPVIETSLEPNTPQTSVRNLGSHIDRRDSVTDEQIDSIPNPNL